MASQRRYFDSGHIICNKYRSQVIPCLLDSYTLIVVFENVVVQIEGQ